MTDQDLTAPEAVERFHASEFSAYMILSARGDYVRYEDYAALSAALENERAKTKRLRGLLSDVIGGWDWWNKDQYDRCQSVPGDAIEAARAELRDGWPF